MNEKRKRPNRILEDMEKGAARREADRVENARRFEESLERTCRGTGTRAVAKSTPGSPTFVPSCRRCGREFPSPVLRATNGGGPDWDRIPAHEAPLEEKETR